MDSKTIPYQLGGVYNILGLTETIWGTHYEPLGIDRQNYDGPREIIGTNHPILLLEMLNGPFTGNFLEEALSFGFVNIGKVIPTGNVNQFYGGEIDTPIVPLSFRDLETIIHLTSKTMDIGYLSSLGETTPGYGWAASLTDSLIPNGFAEIGSDANSDQQYHATELVKSGYYIAEVPDRLLLERQRWDKPKGL